MYYRHVVSKQTFQQVDYHIWRALWRWAKRRHPKKPKRWLYRRYFEVGKYGATFYAESRDRRGQTMPPPTRTDAAIPIVRHVKVKGQREPGRSHPERVLGEQAPQEGSSTRGQRRPALWDSRSPTLAMSGVWTSPVRWTGGPSPSPPPGARRGK